MRISDGSSDVCSSDLEHLALNGLHLLFKHAHPLVDAAAALGKCRGRNGRQKHDRNGCASHKILQKMPVAPMRRSCFRCDEAALHSIPCRSGRRRRSGGRRAAGEKAAGRKADVRSEEHTSELQSLMRISYAVFCLKKKQGTSAVTHNI